jgi:hypothetical protein
MTEVTMRPATCWSCRIPVVHVAEGVMGRDRKTWPLTRDERLLAARASLALARQAFTRLQALVGAGVPPEPADFGAVAANLDDAMRELEAVETAPPFRVLPGGRDRGGR